MFNLFVNAKIWNFKFQVQFLLENILMNLCTDISSLIIKEEIFVRIFIWICSISFYFYCPKCFSEMNGNSICGASFLLNTRLGFEWRIMNLILMRVPIIYNTISSRDWSYSGLLELLLKIMGHFLEFHDSTKSIVDVNKKLILQWVQWTCSSSMQHELRPFIFEKNNFPITSEIRLTHCFFIEVWKVIISLWIRYRIFSRQWTVHIF